MLATGLVELDIWNLTLDGLSQSRVITSAEKAALSSSEARWFNRNYNPTVRALLRANVWTFAKDLAEVEADATAPAFDYAYRFALPNDWVRLLPITDNGQKVGDLIHYEIVGDWIHTDEPGPLKLRGIMDLVDPDTWDHLFVDVAVARLMQKFAVRLTGKVDYKKLADAEFDRAFDAAMIVGAIEEYQEPVEAHDIIRVRDTF